jgi:DNA-binding beta-propeller fold protein YncE
MKYHNVATSAMALALVGIALFSLSCEQATDPPPPIQVDSRVLIKAAEENGRYFVLNINQKALVDTFTLPIDGNGPVVSRDGKRLYLAGRDSTRIFDLPGRNLINILPYNTLPGVNEGVSESSDGQYFAILDHDSVFSEARELYILSTADYSVLYHDTINVGAFGFSPNSEFLFAQTNRGGALPWDRSIRVFRLGSQVTLERTIPFDLGWPWRITGTSDGSRIFVYTSSSSRFVALDGFSGDVLFNIPLAGGGALALSKSEETVYFSNPGGFIIPGDTKIRVYDLAQNNITSIIETADAVPGYPQGVLVSECIITMDGQWLVGVPPNFGGYNILTLDLSSNTVNSILEIEAFNVQPGWVTLWPAQN